MSKIYLKRKSGQSTDYAMKNQDGSGVSWTIWESPHRKMVTVSSYFVEFNDAVTIDENEFDDAFLLASSLISNPFEV